MLLQSPRSSSCRENTSGGSQMRFRNWLCWSHVILASVHIFNLKGRQLISAWKSKSAAFVFGLGRNDGLSLVMARVISDGDTSACSNWTLIVSGVTGEKDMLMLSPFLSILTLCSILSIWFTINNSMAKSTFCLVVLIRMTGTLPAFVVATHLFMTMARGSLWCWACSTWQVILDGILLVCPSTVMTEFPGMQTGFCFEPIVTCPMAPSFPLKSDPSFS